MYFQRAYSSMALSALQRALGHELSDLDLLNLDAHPVGHLERDEGVADIGDPAEEAAARDYFVPGGELRHQRLMLAGALLLRTDQHEIEQGDERHHQQHELQLAAGGGRGRLRPGVRDQGIHGLGSPAVKKGGIMPRVIGAFNINWLEASRGLAAGREEPFRPGGELARGDGRAERAHQADVEVEVVDGVEARAQDLVAAVEVAQVGAGVVAAGVTVAGGVDGSQIVLMGAVADIEHRARGEEVAVAGAAGWPDAVQPRASLTEAGCAVQSSSAMATSERSASCTSIESSGVSRTSRPSTGERKSTPSSPMRRRLFRL